MRNIIDAYFIALAVVFAIGSIASPVDTGVGVAAGKPSTDGGYEATRPKPAAAQPLLDLGACTAYNGMQPLKRIYSRDILEKKQGNPNIKVFEGSYGDAGGAVQLRVTMQKGGAIEISSTPTLGVRPKAPNVELHAFKLGKVLPSWQGWWLDIDAPKKCHHDTGLTFAEVDGFSLHVLKTKDN